MPASHLDQLAGDDERLARLALTLLAEPGELAAGRLVDRYGAVSAVRIGLGLQEPDDTDLAPLV